MFIPHDASPHSASCVCLFMLQGCGMKGKRSRFKSTTMFVCAGKTRRRSWACHMPSYFLAMPDRDGSFIHLSEFHYNRLRECIGCILRRRCCPNDSCRVRRDRVPIASCHVQPKHSILDHKMDAASLQRTAEIKDLTSAPPAKA